MELLAPAVMDKGWYDDRALRDAWDYRARELRRDLKETARKAFGAPELEEEVDAEMGVTANAAPKVMYNERAARDIELDEEYDDEEGIEM